MEDTDFLMFLTMFLTLDSYVELYQGGRIPLSQFAQMPKDRDILIDIIVKKTPLSCVYLSQRNTKTDFPVLTVGASLLEDEARTVIGARPGRAILIQDKKGILKGFKEMSRAQRKEAALKFARFAEENVPVQGNMRGSAEYRKLLTGVLTKRAWKCWEGIGMKISFWLNGVYCQEMWNRIRCFCLFFGKRLLQCKVCL